MIKSKYISDCAVATFNNDNTTNLSTSCETNYIAPDNMCLEYGVLRRKEPVCESRNFFNLKPVFYTDLTLTMKLHMLSLFYYCLHINYFTGTYAMN